MGIYKNVAPNLRGEGDSPLRQVHKDPQKAPRRSWGRKPKRAIRAETPGELLGLVPLAELKEPPGQEVYGGAQA